jgi:hypothetical protein
MASCFVIQPFDSGKYDKRFEDVYSPAIVAAGLEPYRVDRDTGVDIPIDSIEDGIRTATVCLADITTDNPNVWYELGFAFATKCPVIMVCSDERKDGHYPFDIRHRAIISYKSDSPRDFDALKESITNRIKALLKRAETLQAIHNNEQVAPIEGLSQSELAVLATITSNIALPNTGASAHIVKNDIELAGFTSFGFSLGLKRLCDKNFVELGIEGDYNNNSYETISITSNGWVWIEKNEDKFIIKHDENKLVTKESKTIKFFGDIDEYYRTGNKT